MTIELTGDVSLTSSAFETGAGAAAMEIGEDTIAAVFEEASRRAGDAIANHVLEGALIAGLGAGTLTPEMILAVAQRRIDDLDHQVRTLMEELNRRTEQASSISTELGELRNISTDLEPYYDNNGNLDPSVRMENLGVSPAPTIAEYLQDLADREVISEAARSAIAQNRDGLQTRIDDANDRLRDVNSGNEMLMIQMQSTMQNRTSVVQMTTNLLKTLDEANDSIVGNLR